MKYIILLLFVYILVMITSLIVRGGLLNRVYKVLMSYDSCLGCEIESAQAQKGCVIRLSPTLV